MAKGNRDLPIDTMESDLFDLDRYYTGLADFIKKCETPLTIALQGDWGSGKTSMMNMIMGKLTEPNLKCLYFNTWHYAQFSSEDDLSIAFLSELTTEVLKSVSAPEKIVNTFSSMMKNIFKKTKINASYSLLNCSVQMETDFEELFNLNSSFYQDIKKFTKEFEIAIHSFVKKAPRRIVIFIDDLDRLNPERAVELLEIIKIFLDVPGCIFVLAIDYEVVTLGVSKKYGEGLMYQKGKSFFDKMIQVPFRIPVAFYKMDKLLMTSFESMGIDLNEDSQIISDIIKNSVGANPRTVKRLLNTFELIRDILKVSQDDHKTNVLLLAILCIQLCDDRLYQYLTSTREWTDVDSNTVFSFKKDSDPLFPNYSDFLADKLSLWNEKAGSYNYKQTHNLLSLLNEYIHSDTRDMGLDDDSDDFEIFINLLDQSQMTASNAVNSTQHDKELLTDNLDLKKLVIEGFSIGDGGIIPAASFTEAFCKILETTVNPSDFIKLVNDRSKTAQYGLPDRIFYRLDRDKDNDDYSDLGYKKSTIKRIHGQDIILHYGREDLKNYLLKFLRAFHVDNRIYLYVKSNTNEPI